MFLQHCYEKARDYHRPSTCRRMEIEARAEEQRRIRNLIKRNIPRNVAPRKDLEGMLKLESHLTIGRPMCIAGTKENATVNGSVVGVQATSRQEQSMLLRLPLEIKRQIYKEAIGKYKIHISFNQAYRKMSHQRCKHSDSKDCFEAACIMGHKQRGAKDPYGQDDLLALLQSCRMVYGEAVDVLYRENRFMFSKIGNVLRLSMTVLPERMKLIKNVQWKVCYCSPTIHTTTPWLECNSPNTCSCVVCMPEGTYSELKTRRWIIYTWMIRSEKANPGAHVLDQVTHAGN